MNNTFQFVEFKLIPTIGISTALTRSQHENFVIISSLWKRFNYDNRFQWNKPDSIIEIYVPVETVAKRKERLFKVG